MTFTVFPIASFPVVIIWDAKSFAQYAFDLTSFPTTRFELFLQFTLLRYVLSSLILYRLALH